MRIPLRFFALVAPLALIGLYTQRRRLAFYPFIGILAGYTGMLTVLVTGARYRMGMLPALIVLAGTGVAQLATSKVRWSLSQKSIAAGILLAGVILVYSIEPPRIENGRSEAYQLLAEATWPKGEPEKTEKWAQRT